MPVTQTPVLGEQLANMDEVTRASLNVLPQAAAMPPIGGASSPEQELAKLAASVAAAPDIESMMRSPRMPVATMAQGGLPTVRMQGFNPSSYGVTTPMPGTISHYQRYGSWGGEAPGGMGYHAAYGTFGDPTSSSPSVNPHLQDPIYGIVGGGGGGGGGDAAAPTVDRGPVQTLSLGEYAAPPADYRHGIDPQWNYFPGSATVTQPTVDMNTGGMISDAMRLQSAGRGPHDRLVHMTQNEVDAMNALASSGIGGLRANGMAINPNTGLPEAGIWSSILPMIAGLGLTIATGGAASPWLLGAAGAGGSLAGQLIEGEGLDVGRMFLAGLGSWGAGQLGNIFGGAGEVAAANAASIAQPTVNVAGGLSSTIGSGVNIPAGVMGSAGQRALQAQIMNTPANLANVGASIGSNIPSGFIPQHLQSNIVGQNLTGTTLGAGLQTPVDPFQSLLTKANLPQSAADKLAAQYGAAATQDAAMMEAGQLASAADPSWGAIKEGIGTFDPTQWASTPGTVGLKETLMPGGAVLASAGDAFGAFDQPETNWDEVAGIGGYDYEGPYLPYVTETAVPPEGYRAGIDPQFQYLPADQYGYYSSYAKKGGYAGDLPTVRAQGGGLRSFGYPNADVPQSNIFGSSSAQPNQSNTINALAALGQQKTGIQSLTSQAPGPTPKVPTPYSINIPREKLPMLQQRRAAHGGPVGNLIDPQYRWSDTPDPMMREQVYRRANGGLAGIDPQYRWSDTANPAMREHPYLPTVKMQGSREDRMFGDPYPQINPLMPERHSGFGGTWAGREYEDWKETTTPFERITAGMVGANVGSLALLKARQAALDERDAAFMPGEAKEIKRAKALKRERAREEAPPFFRFPYGDKIREKAEELREWWDEKGGPTDDVNRAAAKAMLDYDFNKEKKEVEAESGLTITKGMQAGGLAGIDPQYRWSDVQNPAAREHPYRPTVRMQGTPWTPSLDTIHEMLERKGTWPRTGGSIFEPLKNARTEGMFKLADKLENSIKGFSRLDDYAKQAIAKIIKSGADESFVTKFAQSMVDDLPASVRQVAGRAALGAASIASAPLVAILGMVLGSKELNVGEPDMGGQHAPLEADTEGPMGFAAETRTAPGVDVDAEELADWRVPKAYPQEGDWRVPKAYPLGALSQGPDVRPGTPVPPFDVDAEELAAGVGVPLIGRQFGGVAGMPVDATAAGIMGQASLEAQQDLGERMAVPTTPEQPLSEEENRLVEMTILALQEQLDETLIADVVNEFVEKFGLEAYRELEAKVKGQRENGGIIKAAVGPTSSIQGPDVMPGMVVDPETREQVANLEVGANEFISTANDLQNEAREAGLPPTPDNGAVAMSRRHRMLAAKHGGLLSAA